MGLRTNKNRTVNSNDKITAPIASISNEDITFDSLRHKYYKKGIELMSVTTYLDARFFPAFEEGNKHVFITHNVVKANKRKGIGITNAEDLRAYWRKKGQKASHNGSAAHLMSEMLFIAHRHSWREFHRTMTEEVKTGYEEAVVKVWKQLLKHWDIVGVEVVVGSLMYNLAGTMDLLMKHKTTGEYAILDWKAKDDLDKAYNKCREELKEYKDSGENKATAQMTVYSILGGFNVKPSNIYIVKLNSVGTFEIRGGKKNPLPDMTKQIKKALHERTKTPNKQLLMSML